MSKQKALEHYAGELAKVQSETFIISNQISKLEAFTARALDKMHTLDREEKIQLCRNIARWENEKDALQRLLDNN